MDQSNDHIAGRKVFFLFPSASVRDGVIQELAQREYEVYAAENKDALRRALRKYPDSIVFVDANEKMPEEDRDAWIAAVSGDPDTQGVSIGVIASGGSDELRRKYDSDTKVACGYTALDPDLEKSAAAIMDILQKGEAKGRRKHLRAVIADEVFASISVPLGDARLNGWIKDISAAGVSFSLEGNPDIAKNALVKDIQIGLADLSLNVEGALFGSRMASR
ncbi:MAG: pilus assembly protein PilZ, partial [Treponema sp.]|nr:pilus assembly protein PilZ [Treponema sp.]